MQKNILKLFLLIPSISAADSGGATVLSAILFIPFLIPIISAFLLFKLPPNAKKKTETPENPDDIAFMYSRGILFIFAYIFLIYLSLLPMKLFPDEQSIVISNIAIVSGILIFKIFTFLRNEKII